MRGGKHVRLGGGGWLTAKTAFLERSFLDYFAIKVQDLIYETRKLCTTVKIDGRLVES
jgi:hypothetical protein